MHNPDRKATLEYALRPHAIDPAEVVRRHPAVTNMVRRILGVLPHAASYFEIWPPAFTTYNVSVPVLLDVPRSDLGLGLPASIRALVAYASSRSFGCRYCAAHTAVMGTVLRGPGGTLSLAERALDPGDDARFGPRERAAIDYALAVGRIPTTVTTKHRVELARHFGPSEEEAVVLVATLMGFLNRYMDALGTVLEWPVLTTAREHLSASGWTEGEFFDEELDAEIAVRDREAAEEARRPGKLSLLRDMAGAVAYERAALESVPRTRRGQADVLHESLGFRPGWVERTARGRARRVLAHWVLERLQSPGPQLDRRLAYTLGFVAARVAENPALAAEHAFSAMRAGAEPQELLAALKPPRAPAENPWNAALALGHAVSRAGSAIDLRIIDAVVQHYRPESIIALLTVLSIHAGFQRYYATYVPASYPAEIDAFVREHGELLGLPPCPATEDQARWDELAALARD